MSETATIPGHSAPFGSTSADRNHRSSLSLGAAVGLGLVVGGALVAYAENLAASGNVSSHFTVFWIGYFAATLPLVAFLVGRRIRDDQRAALVLVLAVWSLVPKWIRTGIQPFFSDEFQHSRLLGNLVRTGHPTLQPVVLLVGGHFPGLEMLTAGFSSLTGLSVAWSGAIIASVAHVAIVMGIFALVSEVTNSIRGASIAAVVYFLNPGYLFFDAQYAYETLALVFVVWTLVFAVRAMDLKESRRSLRERWFNVVLGVVSTTALIFTHHVTAVLCAGILLVLAVLVTVTRHNEARATPPKAAVMAWTLAGYAIAITVVRFVELRTTFKKYLAPVYNVSQQFHQLLSFFGIGKVGAQRTLSGGQSVPTYEVLSTYLMIPILLGAYLLAVWLLWRRRNTVHPMVIAAAALSLFFFASLPLDTSTTLDQVVHRSWAYSFIGLAVVLGAGSCELPELRRLWRVSRFHTRVAGARVLVAVTLLVSYVVVSFGAVSGGTDIYYRFGSPVVPAVDAASIGTQTTMVRDWIRAHGTASDVVFGDRYVMYPIIGTTDVLVAPKIEHIWDFSFAAKVSLRDLGVVYGAHVTYMIVDRRMATHVPPLDGYWYYAGEPYSTSHKTVPASYIYRYRCFSWMSSVFVTKDYTVYAVDRSALRLTIVSGHIGVRKGCQKGLSNV